MSYYTGRPLSSEEADQLKGAIEFIDSEVNRLKDYSSFEKRPVDFEEIVPTNILSERIKLSRLMAYGKRRSRSVTFRADFNVPKEYRKIRVDKRFFSDAIVNMLMNAIEADDTGETLIVDIRMYTTDDSFVVEIEDNGPGIPGLAHLREVDIAGLPFPQAKRADGNTGYALRGLARWAHDHGGKILLIRTVPQDVARKNGEAGGRGTLFRILLPLANVRVNEIRTPARNRTAFDSRGRRPAGL